MNHLNIEIKARCSDAKKIRKILTKHNADFRGVDHQIDTYFRVNSGRLKLMEGNIENHFIYYEREDKEGPKQSNVTLMPTVLYGESLKEILVKSLGVLAVVDKRREIYFIGNVKFHLDDVCYLGKFVEIKAINYDRRPLCRDVLFNECSHYLKLFNISQEDLVSRSYSDMIMEMQSK